MERADTIRFSNHFKFKVPQVICMGGSSEILFLYHSLGLKNLSDEGHDKPILVYLL